MYKTVIVSILFYCTLLVTAQTPISVAENTFKIPPQGEEIFYYGFAEGEQLIFNFEEINGKELKEIEIIQLNGSSKFMDYKSKKIEGKIINITETAIYKFRFANANIIAGRICKVNIQRIPESDKTKKFNSNVYKRFVYDTTYYNDIEKFLVKTDTSINELVNQTAKVHSNGNLNGNKTTFNFNLPPNTISWSYYIGVDQAGHQAYETATKQLSTNAAPLMKKFIGYSPLAAVALNAISYLPSIQKGEDIDFYIVPGDNVNLFLSNKQFSYIKKGKVINDFSKMSPYPGNLHVCFSNDNAVTGVTVMVKITAIQVNETWDTRPIKKMNIQSRQEMYLKN